MLLTQLARKIVSMGLLSHTEVIEATRHAVANNQSFYSYITTSNIVSFSQICDLVSKQYQIPIVDLDSIDKEKIPRDAIEQNLIEKHRVLPLYYRKKDLHLAVAEPVNATTLDEIRYSCQHTIKTVLVDPKKLDLILQHVINTEATRKLTKLVDKDALSATPLQHDIQENESDYQIEENAPIIKFVHHILSEAIKQRASDIHIEPYEKFSRVRFRVDGIMHEALNPNRLLVPKIIARIKILSSLNIAEKRIPQDGKMKITFAHNQSVDFRVSIAPTLYGEKAVIRILDTTQNHLSLDKIGMTSAQRELYQQATHQPNGMILVSGPTGSGKTVSLYAALNQLNTAERNISSVEDPVEIYVPGINQVNINEKAGLTFSKALRAFLRQDPDVIMVGEIRDTETAEIATKAAQTGHLVLSTVHANDASAVVTRLVNIGIAPFNICASISLIIAQRLVRKLCIHCRQVVPDTERHLLQAGLEQQQINDIEIYQAVGCASCTKGYNGRTGIFEVVSMTPSISDIILSKGTVQAIDNQIRKEGYPSLYQSAIEKVKNGITTLEEITRVII